MADVIGSEGRDGEGGTTPLAWPWSEYKGEFPGGPSQAEETSARDEAAAPLASDGSPYSEEFPRDAPAADAGSQRSAFPGLVVAAVIVIIAGLTWLYASNPESSKKTLVAPQAETVSPPSGDSAPSATTAPPSQPAEAPAPTSGAGSPRAAAPDQAAPNASAEPPATKQLEKKRAKKRSKRD